MLIAVLTIGVMMHFAQSARTWLTEVDGEVDDAEHAFEMQCLRSENTMFAFAIGLLLMQTVRYAICHEPIDFHGPQFNNNDAEIYSLFASAWCFGLGIFVFDCIRRWLERRNVANGSATPMTIRGLGLLQELCAMTMGWSLFYSGKWWFWYMLKDQVEEGDILTGQLCMAVLCSIVSMLILIIFDKLSDWLSSWGEGIRSVMTALVMLMGLAWQSVFVTAIKCRSHAEYAGSGDEFKRAFHDFQIALFLCILIIPAWALYMLPKFEDGVEDSKANAAEDGTATAKH